METSDFVPRRRALRALDVQKARPTGIATLGTDSRIPVDQLPTDVLLRSTLTAETANISGNFVHLSAETMTATTRANVATLEVNQQSTTGALSVVGYAGAPGVYDPSGSWTRVENFGGVSSSESARIWSSMIWVPELDRFVAVSMFASGLGTIAVSSDGVTWTRQNLFKPFESLAPGEPFRTFDLYSVVYSAKYNRLVVVGDETNEGVGIIYTSDDGGTTWQIRTHTAPKPVYYFNTVTWSPELERFVALGSGSTGFTYDEGVAMYSDDGITWTSAFVPIASLVKVIWVAEQQKFVAISSSGSLITSQDGITWSSATTMTGQSAAGTSWSVAWSPALSLYVAVGIERTSGQGNSILTSTDAATWVSRTAPVSHTWNSVVWSPEAEIFVAVGETSSGLPIDVLITSKNGMDWTAVACPLTRLKALEWNPKHSFFLAGPGNDFTGIRSSVATKLVECKTAEGSSALTIFASGAITSAGKLSAGSVSSAGPMDVDGAIRVTTRANTAAFVSFVAADGTTIGSITTANNATAVAYNTTSDYRLKENILPLERSSERLLQLQPKQYNFTSAPEHRYEGFIAHEVQEVVPFAVTGEKDAMDAAGRPVYQSMDYSMLVPLLTGALQESIQRIAQLERDVAGLQQHIPQ